MYNHNNKNKPRLDFWYNSDIKALSSKVADEIHKKYVTNFFKNYKNN